MTPDFRPPAELKKYPSLCIQCGGPVTEDHVTLSLVGLNGHVRLVRGVPAGVCGSCGEQYLRPEVTARVEQLLQTPPRRNEEVPAWDFAASA
jgi:YgiT-type zinc finger domain-containing protein